MPPPAPAALVTLPMYDLVEVRSATRSVAATIAAAVSALGRPAVAADTDLATHAELETHWGALVGDGGDGPGAVAVTQTCGLPLVETLAGRAEVLGTFVWRGVSRPDGWYRSVVVVRADAGDDLRGRTPAVNHPQSLSGWASLGWALAWRDLGPGDTAPAVVTGGHAASLAAVAEGRADVASIDAATFALIARARPTLAAAVRVVDHGPWVPATPLVTGPGSPGLDELRAALATALAAPALAAVRDVLGIEAFVPLTTADYAGVPAIVAVAERALPRVGTHALAR